MSEIIVTSGQPFTDIDALACAIAYNEVLNLEGKRAQTVLPGPLNNSITKKVKEWKLDFRVKPSTNKAEYVLVDVSEPKFFANFVKKERVIEVFDHRVGFEKYWKERLEEKSHIEMVGACATLIWEEFKKRKLSNKISEVSANLLYTAILSNTLNFKASVTSKKDIKAYEELKQFSNLPKNWVETYFTDQDKEVDKDIKNALINDTKDLEPIIGQLELWDSKKVILKHLKEIEEVLLSFGRPDWFLTAPSISEGKNYLFTRNPKMKTLLERSINAKFHGDIGTTNKLWLRKEIINLIK